MRELRETRHQFDRPFILDSSAHVAEFAGDATPFDEAIAATVRWWQQRQAAAVPSQA
ncbi:MAG: hypothetical protein H0V10_04055 [Geodermatophilaceae bacterium]|nr:hypothetical protein [Geodermatophilaceae bacterium]